MSIPFSAAKSDSPMNRIHIKRINDLTDEVKTLKDKLARTVEALDKMYRHYGEGQAAPDRI